LEFYADRDKYDYSASATPAHPINHDRGGRARQALAANPATGACEVDLLKRAADLLKRGRDTMNRAGWEDGESDAEWIEAVGNWLWNAGFDPARKREDAAAKQTPDCRKEANK
jgi:hypothetical protein